MIQPIVLIVTKENSGRDSACGHGLMKYTGACICNLSTSINSCRLEEQNSFFGRVL